MDVLSLPEDRWDDVYRAASQGVVFVTQEAEAARQRGRICFGAGFIVGVVGLVLGAQHDWAMLASIPSGMLFWLGIIQIEAAARMVRHVNGLRDDLAAAASTEVAERLNVH
jgi:hypothetical protein